MLTEKIYSYDNHTLEEWQEFIRGMNNSELLRIDESMFYYWLEVLPPVYMYQKQLVEIDGVKYVKNCIFGFAEGAETVIDFWKSGEGVYFCKRSDRFNWGF